MFARIAFPIPHIDYFTYEIPDRMSGQIHPGMIVDAPFGNQSAAGVVLEITEKSDIPSGNIREIVGLRDPDLSIPLEMMALVTYTAGHYGTTPGIVLKSALPPGALQRKKVFFYPGFDQKSEAYDEMILKFIKKISDEPGRWSFSDLKQLEGITRRTVDSLINKGIISVSPFKTRKDESPIGKKRWLRAAVDSIPEKTRLGPKARQLLESLIDSENGIKLSALKDMGFSQSSAATLHRHGLIEYEYRDTKISDIGSLKSLVKEEVFELTLWQRSALEKIEAAVGAGSHKGFLLYGVTSSGKTQVYLEAAKSTIEDGKSVLVLVPEITLTPQIIARFERFLNVAPLVWHSHLSPAERVKMFKAARSGRGRLVIGARSAIFCPLENLGLIIVDEEQDHSYKQDDPAPRYNARDLALKRGQIAKAVVVLGSATPSVESYHAAVCGKLDFLTLPQRVAGSGNPRIKIISTAVKPEQKRDSRPIFPRGFWPISEALYTELSIRMKRNEQVIILLNRRGYSSSVVCFECGWLGKCPDCDIGWTYYKSRNMMVCHYCGTEKMGPTVCPKCESANLSFRGAGTERLEETLRQLFPGATIKRLDSDVALRKWKSRDILDEFGRGGFRILIGTQMVAKGHHFPAVGFVAIIGADIGLSLPDFRATERVLQLLIQASGRAGRSGKKSAPGTVMVQTFAPQAIIFKYLKAHDFTGFLESEIKVREAMGYPPFKKLIQAVVSSNNSLKASRAAKSLKEDIKDISVDKHIEVLGPAQSPIFKRGKHYRFQILLKIALEDEPEDLLRVLNEAARRARGFSVKIDVDPLTFV